MQGKALRVVGPRATAQPGAAVGNLSIAAMPPTVKKTEWRQWKVIEESRYGGLRLNEREKRVLRLADQLLALTGQRAFDEAWLDSQFLFRFDPLWSSRVDEIRKTMRVMLGKSGPDALAESEGIRWYMHLLNNFGFSPDERPRTAPNPYYSLKTAGAYYQDDPEWPDQVQAEVDESLGVRQKLHELAVLSNLLPNPRDAEEWSPADHERQFHGVVGWVLFDTGTPVSQRRVVRYEKGSQVIDNDTLLPWEVTKLEEHKTGKGIQRWIRPRAWDFLRDGHDPRVGRGQRMTTVVRIRTWTAYYLTKRGGGERKVHTTSGPTGAVEMWNELHGDLETHYTKYHYACRKLFERGTAKK
jgi:hypothetical protein